MDNIKINTDTVTVSQTIDKDEYLANLQTALQQNLESIAILDSQKADILAVNKGLQEKIDAAS